MKKLLLLTFAACLTFSMAMAQPDPANFNIYYGNSDGTPQSVGIDRDIFVDVWMATDPTPGNPDSVTFMHDPLASDNGVITVRYPGNPGTPPPPPPYSIFVGRVALWDDISFLAPDLDNPIPGFTNQSILGFAFINLPRSPENFVYNLGVPELVARFLMHTANDPGLIGQTICPFMEGNNPQNHTHVWGMQDGVRQVVPTQHYGCLFFSPNVPPVLVEPAGGVVTLLVHGCFMVRAEDVDGDPVQISLAPGQPGTFHQTLMEPGVGEGDWCGDVADSTPVVFLLNDGQNPPEPATVLVRVVGCPDITEATLAMTCGEGVPGGHADVFVELMTNGCVGGFEILIRTDPTALDFLSVTPLPPINGGSEYFNHVADPFGPGTDRFVWIADINNGVPASPMAPSPFLIGVMKVTFAVDPGLPWGMHIPVDFMITDYTDNTISDQTGYTFFHPVLIPGCVNTTNPEEFRGDPNMNCNLYEVADAVLVARRLIEGYIVWSEDDLFGQSPDCDMDTHYPGNDPLQEAGADLNGNGFADVADLVRFVNILNGYIIPPKLDPASGLAVVSLGDGIARINSGLEVGGVLVRISHDGQVGTPAASNGMDILSRDADGVLSVLVYSLAGSRIPAGNSVLFTVPGEGNMTITEVSAADSFGRLLDVTARQDAPLPTVFTVKPNYPNPFNARTAIHFALPQAGQVTVNVYSITGQLVETLGGYYDAGYHQVTWDASNNASGIYFAKIASGDVSQTVKMTLLK